jgi:ribosomal protein L9
VEIQNLHYSLVVNNAIWTAIADLFNSQVLGVLHKHSSIDLSSELRDAEQKIFGAVGTANIQGLTIKADPPQVGLENIIVGPKNLVGIARLTMKFSTEITQDLLSP